MDLVSGLQDLHLTESEARVYIALLAMEAGTPLSLANTTGLKRPTVYLILETLRRKRLAGLTFRGKKTFYSAEPPSRLLRHLDEQRQTALELLPILKAMIRQPCGRAVIRYFDHPRRYPTILARGNMASTAKRLPIQHGGMERPVSWDER